MSFPLPPDAAAYLEALRAEFADLPVEERDDLLADVETSLIEAADDGDIAARLGSPADFAAELRAAAGIEAAPAAAASPGALDEIAAAIRRLGGDPRIAAVLRPFGELAPIWWFVRGFLAAGVLALAVGVTWTVPRKELPRSANGREIAFGFVVLLVASLWLGLSRRRVSSSSTGRRLLVALNVGLAIAAIPIVSHLRGLHAPVDEITVTAPTEAQPGLTYNGATVTNLYPYTRSGRLLQDVLLYDELGQPVEVGGPAYPDPDRRVLITPAGSRIFNSFPIRYYEPQTTLVAHPYAGPPVKLPQVLTPRLVPTKAAN